MLIDCGSFRNSGVSTARLDKIATAIAKELAGAPIDVVVGTHQHNDHLSGFVHCEQAFRTIGVEQVWLSWLDNPLDKKAQKIGKDHHNLTLQLHAARAALASSLKRSRASRPLAARSFEVLDDVLGFYGASDGAPPKVPADAVKILKAIGTRKPEYLEPGRTLDMPGMPPGSVRVHVLGPPRKDEDLYRKDPGRARATTMRWRQPIFSPPGSPMPPGPRVPPRRRLETKRTIPSISGTSGRRPAAVHPR